MDLIQEEQQSCSVVCEFAHRQQQREPQERTREEKRRTEKSQSCCADAEPNGDDYAKTTRRRRRFPRKHFEHVSVSLPLCVYGIPLKIASPSATPL